MRSLLPRLAGVRVLVVGDLMLDAWVEGQATRLSPEAPVPVIDAAGCAVGRIVSLIVTVVAPSAAATTTT